MGGDSQKSEKLERSGEGRMEGGGELERLPVGRRKKGMKWKGKSGHTHTHTHTPTGAVIT